MAPPNNETPAHGGASQNLIRILEDALINVMGEAVWDDVKDRGFAAAQKTYRKRNISGQMSNVLGGVVEETPTGIDASLHTERGQLLIRNGQRTNPGSDDPQFISTLIDLTPDQLIEKLADGNADSTLGLMPVIELTRFNSSQNAIVLPLLWRYIVGYRNSNNRGDLAAVGSAIRKYIAIMPMDRMGDLTDLLECGHRSQLPAELEIEVFKMIYRNFEVHPPVATEPHPELAQRLFEIAKAYTNPYILLRGKHSAAASLAILAIVSMRSELAEDAYRAALDSPYKWFAEMVSDDLDVLHEKWIPKNSHAAEWLLDVRRAASLHV